MQMISIQNVMAKQITLILLKAKGSLFIFSSFTTVAWESHYPGQFKSDPNAFLFCLINKGNIPCKMKMKSKNFAIHCNSYNGPSFGVVNIFSNSSSILSRTYKHPQYVHGTNEAQSFFD